MDAVAASARRQQGNGLLALAVESRLVLAAPTEVIGQGRGPRPNTGNLRDDLLRLGRSGAMKTKSKTRCA